MGSAAPELAACPPRIWGHLQPTQHPGESIAATAALEFWQTGEEEGGGTKTRYQIARRNLTFLVAPTERKRDKSY